MDLSGLVQVIDPASGDTRNRAVRVSADGINSVVDLSSLTDWQDRDTGSFDGNYPGVSSLAVQNSGIVQTPLLATLSGTSLTLNGSGTLDFPAVTAPPTRPSVPAAWALWFRSRR